MAVNSVGTPPPPPPPPRDPPPLPVGAVPRACRRRDGRERGGPDLLHLPITGTAEPVAALAGAGDERARARLHQGLGEAPGMQDVPAAADLVRQPLDCPARG